MVSDQSVRSGPRLYTLEELGIRKTKDVYGEHHLTIDLPPNELFGSGSPQAIYDELSQRWTLSASAHSKFGITIDHRFKYKTFVEDGRSVARPVQWTEVLPKTEHVDKFLNTIDWQSTSLGPLETWPRSLQAYLNIVFADSQAAVIYWGDDLVALYNESFTKLIAGRLSKPEDLFGTPFVQIWPELWDEFDPMLRTIAARGTGIETLEVNLFPFMNGIHEETFWQGSFLPIQDDMGVIRGFYNRAREITKNVINERRAKILNGIASKPNLTGSFIYTHIINCLSLAERDFPLAFIYSAEENSSTGKCKMKFEGGAGLPEQRHALLPAEFELYEGHAGFVPHIRKAKGLDRALVLHKHDDSLPANLVEGFHWKGFGEPSRSIAILPLSTSDRLLAVLVVGLNPRRPHDEEYEGFLNTLLRSSSATVASAVDREEARNRAERLAQQLADQEKAIREIAEYGPVGIARLTPSGNLAWANDQFYEITGHGRDKEDHYELSFVDVVFDEDRSTCINFWKSLSEHKASSTAFRIKRQWQPPSNPEDASVEKSQNVWVLASGYPIMDDQEVKALAVSVSDISRFKWAEQVQTKGAAAAKEAKRLQENFIDIVSHEMRNPLSAITQLSDAISTSLDEFEATKKSQEDAREILGSNVDSASTILLCAAHQKRIIDDVLTLSKLDSMLLSITPVIVQPYKIVEGVLRMFDAEFAANKIEVDSKVTESYEKHQVDWVSLDPSRLTQIFINLITNAVKFTKTEVERRISIRVGATNLRPPSLANVRWYPTNKIYKDLTLSQEWGDGEPIYICFEVQDTGRGLEQDEMNKLFGRFQQATAKTHIKYGGSGLGLFISRELTETQGGEIGCRSEPSKGTTFAFYIKGRKASMPSDPSSIMQPFSISTTARNQNRQAQQQHELQNIDESKDKKNLKVLLCEDNVVNAKVLKRQLTKANCEVYVANHGMEALDLLQRSLAWHSMSEEQNAIDYDVILMDVEMPIMDGLTCTRRIRQLEKEGKLRHRLKIIAITANARQEQIDNVKQAGADDVLPKPFRVNECLSRIRDMLAQEPNQSVKG